ncbi:MAG: hypothetical protein HY794_04100 [Desulfarculus sp.]|nr:hypothetical protein [Desulfarculus sp.]
MRLNEDAARRLSGFAQAAMAKEKAGLATPIDVFRASIQLKQKFQRQLPLRPRQQGTEPGDQQRLEPHR